MKIKYHIPISLQHVKPIIIRCALFMGLVICIMANIATAASYDNISTNIQINNDTTVASNDVGYTGFGTLTSFSIGHTITPDTNYTAYLNFSGMRSYTNNFHNATIWLYKLSEQAQTVYIYNVNSTWDENTLWPGIEPTNETTRYTYILDGTGGWKSFNITDIAQNWTYGIKIVPMNMTGANETDFFSSKEGANVPYIIAYSNPVLLYPTNNLQIYTSFPPLSTSINFTWASSHSNSYNIQVATDPLFNLLTSDLVIYLNYSVQSLSLGEYYWRVRYYDITTSTYSPWSVVYTFIISNSATVSGTGVNGIVYELSGTTKSPISGAVVILSNSTYTDTQITGSNGYYQFTNISSGTYAINAIRQDIYTDSITYYTTIIDGTVYTQDIQLQRCVSGFTCFYNQQYVQFIVTDYWVTTRYAGVTAQVFTDGSVVPILSSITGTDGSVSFLLIKNQQYTITFTNVSAGIDTTVTIIPTMTLYYIRTSATPYDWHSITGGYDVNVEVSSAVTISIINSTHAYINVSYNDSISQTSGLIFYLNTSVASDPLNKTILQTHSSGSSATHNYSFIVSGYTCVNYFINIKAAHITFGAIDRSYGIIFPGMCNPSGLNSTLMYYFGVALLIFVGGLAGATSSTQVGGVVVFMGWVLQLWGWISEVNTSIGLTAGLTLATVFIAISMINDRAKTEGVA